MDDACRRHELGRVHRALRLLSDSNRMLTRVADEEAWLHAVCLNSVERGGYRMAWVAFAQQDEQKTVRAAARAGLDDGYIESAAITWADEPRGRGPVGTAIRTGRPSITRNVPSDPAFAPWRTAALDRGYQSLIALPLVEDGRTFGALAVYAGELDAFDPEEVEILSELADDLVFGLGVLRTRRERESVAAALAESQARLEESARQVLTLTDHSPDPIVRLARGGQYLYVNAVFERLAGISRSELVGRRIGEATAARMSKSVQPEILKLREMIDQVLDTGVPLEMELSAVLAPGNRTFDIRLIPERDDAGQVASVLLIGRDITERRRAEERMRQLEEQTRHTQRLEAIGRLAGGVAHDFNNNLTAISGFANLALMGLDDEDDRRRDNLREVQKAVERASALTRQLLAFSRRQVLQPKNVDLNALLADLEPMLRRTIGEHIQLHLSLTPALEALWADASQLQQVIVNLAVNARDAMPGGGELRFTTALEEVNDAWQRQRPAVASAIPLGRYVRLTASDSGEGMSAETRARIFEPFFSTKPAGKGTGLGLAMIYGIIKQSGGYIWVTSEVGVGTSFDIYLPAMTGKSEPVAAVEPVAALERGSETVLLAEDDDAVRQFASQTLTRFGYHVLEARNGEEALAIAREYAGAIQLLVTDIVMPGLTGPALAERLKIERPATRVLFTSGYADSAAALQNAELRRSFLPKPFLPAELLKRVREVLDAARQSEAKG
jgi:two-component system, cell cycle sensor histidine kinase and response regulator CckA